MSVSFNQIPAALRVPGAYIEFDNSLANLGGAFIPNIAIIAQQASGASAIADEPVLINSGSDLVTLFGDSAAKAVAEAALKVRTFAQLYIVPVASVNDMSGAIDAIYSSNVWFNYLALPTWNDSCSDLPDYLDALFHATVQEGMRVFVAKTGTQGELATFGNTFNSPHITVMGLKSCDSGVDIFAATNAIIAGEAFANDPARPAKSLKLPFVTAETFGFTERNALLFDGISTVLVGKDGTVTIERQITTYQDNAAGLPDNSYLNMTVVETLERIRLEQRIMITSRYPRHKVADDGTNYPPGQPIVTPTILKGLLLELYQEFINKGWVEGMDGYKSTLHAEVNVDDRSRIDFVDNPNLVAPLYIVAGQSQFLQ